MSENKKIFATPKIRKFARELVCLVGRGDSGKTTLLEAIKCVFSPVWNHSFYDVDFYQLYC